MSVAKKQMTEVYEVLKKWVPDKGIRAALLVDLTKVEAFQRNKSYAQTIEGLLQIRNEEAQEAQPRVLSKAPKKQVRYKLVSLVSGCEIDPRPRTELQRNSDRQMYELVGFTAPESGKPFGEMVVRLKGSERTIGVVPQDFGCAIVEDVNSGEYSQTWRFQWRHNATGFYVVDTSVALHPPTAGMGDLVDMFGDPDTMESLPVGSQRFYDALNMWFEHCQEEIEEVYFR